MGFNLLIMARSRGGTEDTPLFWRRWLEGNPNFEQVGTNHIDIPIGTWKKGKLPKKMEDVFVDLFSI